MESNEGRNESWRSCSKRPMSAVSYIRSTNCAFYQPKHLHVLCNAVFVAWQRTNQPELNLMNAECQLLKLVRMYIIELRFELGLQC